MLVYAADALTANFLSYEVSINLEAALKNKFWLLPEPAWTLTDFATQCQNDPMTQGAFVVYDVENDVGSNNYFAVLNTYAHLYAKSFFVTCSRQQPRYSPSKSDSSNNVITQVSQTATFNEYPGAKPTASPPPTSVTHEDDSGSAAGPKDTSGSKDTAVYPTGNNLTTSISASIIPKMEISWLSRNELDTPHNAANEYSIPLLSAVVAGAYLAARSITETTSIQQTVPQVPGTTNFGSTQITTQKQGNNSVLPYGLAYLGASLSALSNTTLGGSNQNRVLKSAAAGVASALRRELRTDCLDLKTLGHGKTQVIARKSDSPDPCKFFSEDKL